MVSGLQGREIGQEAGREWIVDAGLRSAKPVSGCYRNPVI